jgi:hypothetical protein
MTKDELRNAVAQRVATVEHEIAAAQEASAACPWCGWGCWCDGDWSPEAKRLRLEEEHSRLEALLGG